MTGALQKTITLVTGGNGGIGYELVAQLINSSSNHVLLGSRSAERGESAVKELTARNAPGTVELLQIDVTDDKSIAAAAEAVKAKHGRLDALVNNAAVAIPSGSLAEQMALCFQTNATGPLLVVEAFAPLLEKAHGTARIVNVTSGAGSITKRLDPTSSAYNIKSVQYQASKAALNMVSACQVYEYREQGFKIFSFCPGFTVSNLSSQNSADNGAKPTSEGAAPIVSILKGDRDAEHSGFLHATGQYPW